MAARTALKSVRVSLRSSVAARPAFPAWASPQHTIQAAFATKVSPAELTKILSDRISNFKDQQN
eukprot:5225643-Amphidinium_carterae.1